MEIKIEDGVVRITVPVRKNNPSHVANRRSLEMEWGRDCRRNLEIARKGFFLSKATQNDVVKLEATIGYVATMKAFYEIGLRFESPAWDGCVEAIPPLRQTCTHCPPG